MLFMRCHESSYVLHMCLCKGLSVVHASLFFSSMNWTQRQDQTRMLIDDQNAQQNVQLSPPLFTISRNYHSASLDGPDVPSAFT